MLTVCVYAGFHGDIYPQICWKRKKTVAQQEDVELLLEDSGLCDTHLSDHLILIGVDEVRQTAGQTHPDHLREITFISST